MHMLLRASNNGISEQRLGEGRGRAREGRGRGRTHDANSPPAVQRSKAYTRLHRHNVNANNVYQGALFGEAALGVEEVTTDDAAGVRRGRRGGSGERSPQVRARGAQTSGEQQRHVLAVVPRAKE